MISQVKFDSPIGYYFWLRSRGYRPSTACTCCIMRFSKTSKEYHRRLRQCSKVINRRMKYIPGEL